LKRNVLRLDVKLPVVTDRERRVFVLYGVLSVFYMTAILASLALLAGRFVVSRWGGWGWVVVGVVVWMAARRPAASAVRVGRVWVRDRLAHARNRRTLAIGALVGAALIATAFLVPWTTQARGAAIVEPTFRTWLRVPEPARVDAVLVSEGEAVRRGQPLVRLRADDLDVALAGARAAVAALDREVAAARGATSRLRAAEIALASRRAELGVLLDRAARLELAAPFDGVVVTPRTDLLAGAGFDRGAEVIELWAPTPRRLRIRLAQREVAHVEAGDAVNVRFAAWPGTDFGGVVESIRAASQEDVVEVLAAVSDPEGLLRPGLRGRAKIAADRVTVARALARWARRLVRADFLL
jgi:multidrug resistance efflux pump